MLKMHPEKSIGIKICSDADLGRSTTSHQTHTGLSERVFSFLGPSETLNDCIFIHDDKIEKLTCLFDKILGNNGKYRSPKIRLGTNIPTVLSTMREIAKQTINDLYLIYFALEDKTPVFIFIDKNSIVYAKLSELGTQLCNIRQTVISEGKINYHAVSTYLLNYLEDLQYDKKGRVLEEFIQTETIKGLSQDHKFSAEEIVKAKQDFAVIGRRGEEFINSCLSSMKERDLISDFKWNNEITESFEPFDFEIITDDKKIYIEVKSTGYDFNQKMIFSRNEIEFAVEHPGNYHIYRVYRQGNDSFDLKICEHTVDIIAKIHETLEKQEEQIKDVVDVSFLNVAIDPSSIDFK